MLSNNTETEQQKSEAHRNEQSATSWQTYSPAFLISGGLRQLQI
jgi:hypothetical protein